MKLRLLLALFCVALLTACPPSRQLTIFNNTGQELIVNAAGKRLEWKPASTLVISDVGRLCWSDLKWIPDTSGTSFPMLQVGFAETQVVYRLRPGGLPDTYVDRSTGKVSMAFQLQPDRKLYAVKANVPFPVDVRAPQPSGFPIDPIEQNSTDNA
jgi:hypothetical protein